MSKTNILRTIMAAVMICSMVAGCSKDDAKGSLPQGEVRFSASTAEQLTKTSYGSAVASGSTQDLKWSAGDSIRVFSPQATYRNEPSQHWADYVVKDAGKTSTSIANAGSNGLVWGEGTNSFYAIYPSTGANGDIAVNGAAVTATIPKAQVVKQDSTTATLWNPDMKYAYMFAAITAEESSSSIPLTFQPMFTAFEINVGPAAGVAKLTGFTMTSDEACLSGTYSGTITANATSGSSTMAFDALPTSNPTSNGVEVSFGTGIDIVAGEPITFTVFVIPHDYVITSTNGLTLTFSVEGGDKTMLLKTKSSSHTFYANRKFNIKGIEIPASGMFAQQLAGYGKDETNGDGTGTGTGLPGYNAE